MILAIDTALNHCSVAVTNCGIVLHEDIIHAQSTQSEILPQIIKQCFDQDGISREGLQKIAVTIGPGSFNGVRIGLGFAKSFSLALNLPCIGVSTLDVLLQSSNAKNKAAIISSNGSFFIKSVKSDECKISPKRLNLDELSEFDAIDYDEIIAISDLEMPNFPNLIKAACLSPSILGKMAQHLDENSNPPIPLYLRGADAKAWAGSQYV